MLHLTALVLTQLTCGELKTKYRNSTCCGAPADTTVVPFQPFPQGVVVVQETRTFADYAVARQFDSEMKAFFGFSITDQPEAERKLTKAACTVNPDMAYYIRNDTHANGTATGTYTHIWYQVWPDALKLQAYYQNGLYKGLAWVGMCQGVDAVLQAASPEAGEAAFGGCLMDPVSYSLPPWPAPTCGSDTMTAEEFQMYMIGAVTILSKAPPSHPGSSWAPKGAWTHPSMAWYKTNNVNAYKSWGIEVYEYTAVDPPIPSDVTLAAFLANYHDKGKVPAKTPATAAATHDQYFTTWLGYLRSTKNAY